MKTLSPASALRRDARANALRCGALLLAAVLSLLPGAAAADESATQEAQQLLDLGREQMDRGETAAACASFEKARDIQRGVGVEFNLARCYAEGGRLASAYRLFQVVAEVSRRTGQLERAAVASEQAAALEPRLSRLILLVQEPPGGLTITIDDNSWPAEEWRRGTPLDPGNHVVVAKAPGVDPWKRTILVPNNGRALTLTIPPLGDTALSPAGSAPDDTGSTALVVGAIVGGVGLIGMGVGVGLGFAASAKNDEADAYCNAQRQCDPPGLERVDEAQSLGDVGTGVFVAGSVLAAAGLVTVLVAALGSGSDADGQGQRATLRVTPWLAPTSWGLALDHHW